MSFAISKPTITFASAGLVAILTAVYFVSIAYAQTDTVTVDVTIQSVSEITVTPTSLSFSVQPGEAAATENLVDIKNTGSNNVSQIYVYVDTNTTENVRPYSSPLSTSYSAGGVIVLRNSTAATPYFAGRLEWNTTAAISNQQYGNVTSPVAWGFYKNASREYNFLIGNGTPTAGGGSAIECNGTGTQFAISDFNDVGSAVTRSPSTTSITRDAGVSTWSFFQIDRSTSPLNGACVAVFHDCSKVYIYKYDRRAPYNACTNSAFLRQENLVPGATETMNVTAWVPQGIPNNPGALNTSIMTVTGT